MNNSNLKRFAKDNKMEIGVFALLLVMCIIAALTSPVFLSYQNISSISTSLSYYGTIASGAAIVMIMGGLDLSQMSTMAISVVVCSQILLSGVDGAAAFAIISAVVIGLICGFINGVIVTFLKIPPMIATIGTQYIYRSIAFILVDGQTFWIGDKVFKTIGFGSFLGIPILLWIMLFIFAMVWIMMKYTQLGQNIYAVGSNENAARLSGISIEKTKISAYTLSGLIGGIAGVLWIAQLSASKPTAGQGQELIPIAAVVIGGVSLLGGKGKIYGVMLGVILLMVLSNIMTLLHLNTYLQQLCQGVILIIAVVIGVKRGPNELDI